MYFIVKESCYWYFYFKIKKKSKCCNKLVNCLKFYYIFLLYGLIKLLVYGWMFFDILFIIMYWLIGLLNWWKFNEKNRVYVKLIDLKLFWFFYWFCYDWNVVFNFDVL